MRRGKIFLAAVLAAAITMTSVTPAFAVETVRTETSKEPTVPKLKEKWNTIDGKRYFVKNGVIQTGWLTYGGGRYYLDPNAGGAMVKGLKTIEKKKYYFTSAGKLVTSKYGYKIKNKYYAVSSKGVLSSLSTVEGLAGVQLDKMKGNLEQVFKWVSEFEYKSVIPPYVKKSPAGYGVYGLQGREGDCMVQAYSFYWLAIRRGYDAKVVKGYVPQAYDKNGKPAKFGTHAWVELKINGKTYVCDPSLAQAEYLKYGKDPKPAYRFRYGAKGTYKYFDSNKKLITKK